ncbi:MAG: ABC transporter permease subunit [Oscillospiraceae bacterium]|jgi:putative aldouronate transport system permease protein|nr:ABC transporter permease subunit [Oscillospiraceae bacterium]
MIKHGSFRMLLFRGLLVVVFLTAFIAQLNPARLSGLINRNVSLFTCATSYSTIGNNFVRSLNQGWVEQSPLTITYIGTLVCIMAIALVVTAFCLSLGNTKMHRLSFKFSWGASLVGALGTTILLFAYTLFIDSPSPGRIEPLLPMGIWVNYALFTILAFITTALFIKLPQPVEGEEYELEAKYRLFLMILPFLVLVVLFAYLPLVGWRYAFFDYTPGIQLSMDDFVGFRWFRFLINNPAQRAQIVRVMANTFALSGIGIATSWLPMMFAIFLSELRSRNYKRGVQTLTTIPNYISWVLVYGIAFAIFSTEGFVNWALVNLGIIEDGTNHLMSGSHIWIKMWAWGTWKGLGWGAIIYIASISSIDPQLYEAAMVDGAKRFRRMWHITVPGLLPTYFVLLLLSISNILSNGLDQYLVFENHANRSTIEVLDLYIYNLGLTGAGNIPLSTMIGMLKSVISVVLLFSANKASKWIRGETIV